MIKNVILTSKKNFSWQSMQEIIPFLTEGWRDTNPAESQIINVDETPLRHFMGPIITAENIILTCFTPGQFKIASYIREQLNPTARFLIHLHNQATIACWPMRHWGKRNIFRSTDIFISSCTRDADCLAKSYPCAQSAVIPFSYKELPESIPDLSKSVEIQFLYIGRISSQKNLHTLFLSLYHFQIENREVSWRLNIYGKEDGLGSPNMGLADSEYEKYLMNLRDYLNLNDKIKFHGFIPSERIKIILKEKKSILILPSLHSDENFGMASFQSLINGHLAVLSDWGGHFDFYQNFTDQVFLVPVYKSALGPFINPLDLSRRIKESVDKYADTICKKVPSIYHYATVIDQYKKILELSNDSPIPLIPTKLADAILSRSSSQLKKEISKENQKIFNSYSDPDAHVFLEAYGMNPNLTRPEPSGYKVPWLQEDDGKIQIQDPHRGFQEFAYPDRRFESLYTEGYLY